MNSTMTKAGYWRPGTIALNVAIFLQDGPYCAVRSSHV